MPVERLATVKLMQPAPVKCYEVYAARRAGGKRGTKGIEGPRPLLCLRINGRFTDPGTTLAATVVEESGTKNVSDDRRNIIVGIVAANFAK